MVTLVLGPETERRITELARSKGLSESDFVRALIESRYDAPGRLIVITGRRTWSAAQMLVNALENWTDATFAG